MSRSLSPYGGLHKNVPFSVFGSKSFISHSSKTNLFLSGILEADARAISIAFLSISEPYAKKSVSTFTKSFALSFSTFQISFGKTENL